MPGRRSYGRTAPIEGFPGYDVSDDGKVFSKVASGKGGRHGRFELAQSLDKDGYAYVRLTRGGKRYKRKVHHLVLEAFVGSRPSGKHLTRHLGGNRRDN